jgi:hypothetical protein
VVAAGADYTVWVYNRGGGSITQIYGVTNRIVEKTPVSLPAECCSLFTGPVLAADASGAWFVQGGIAGRARLVHVPVGLLGKREYPLRIIPTGVAVGGGAVWVVGHDSREDEVLRIDPDTGGVTATARFRRSAGVDSIAFGYRAVWVLSSATATLYKIDPRSAHLAGSVEVAHSRATRPEIMPRGGDIFVRVTGGGGTTYSIAPPRLNVMSAEIDGPPSWEENEGQLGSLWWYHQPTGVVNRQEVAGGPIIAIRVTSSRPTAGGPCLTSMTVGSGSLWVTAAPLSDGSVCSR